MLAYAANRRPQRKVSPTALALIVGGHAVALALLITARMDVSGPAPIVRTLVENIPLPKEPSPPPPPPPPEAAPQPPAAPRSHIDTATPIVALPTPGPSVDLGPPPTQIVPDVGPIIDQPLARGPAIEAPKPSPIRLAARLATPPDLLRPPYPDNKRRLEEEATLRLRLSIDDRGRVTAVDPIGAADPEFLASARRHLIKSWRYKPATEDGRPVPTTLTITLRFKLEDA